MKTSLSAMIEAFDSVAECDMIVVPVAMRSDDGESGSGAPASIGYRTLFVRTSPDMPADSVGIINTRACSGALVRRLAA